MDEYPKSITKQRTKIIYNQMNDSFYKIQGKDDKFGIGFFCNIKINDKNILVLVTNYHLIDDKYIENNFGIKTKINNELNIVKFGNKNFCYLDKERDLSIIEIRENKNIKINFLEIDESLYEKESSNLNNNDTIYIIHQNKENEISVSYGIIRYINNYEFSCSCNINSNGNISPIFDLKNNKLIGIYKKSSKYYIKGYSFDIIIKKFIKIFLRHKNTIEVMNEIDLLLKIYKEDVNKNIYFLNHINMDNQSTDNINSNNLNGLNELNTELYINGKLSNFKNYFKPIKEGEYKIKLKIHINLKDCSYMFAECENIIKINFISFNTFYVKSMKYMFYRCINLKEINLSSFDITNVLDMSYMFYECENLFSLNMSSSKNKNSSININYMFYCCKNLSNLDLSNFNIKNYYISMFYNCNKLKVLNIPNFDVKKFNISKDIFYDTDLSERNQELLIFLYNNLIDNSYSIKINSTKMQNAFPFLPFISKYNNSSINMNFILIFNDIILIPTRQIYIDNSKPNSLFFPQIKENIEYNANNFIIENNDYNNNFTIIKVLNKNFLFETYFRLPNDSFDSLEIQSREKFFINENKKEVCLGINFQDNNNIIIKHAYPGSPIYIKRANQLYLIGVVNGKSEAYLFNSKKLIDFKKKIDNIELKLKFYQIKKLDFQNQKIGDSDMNFIFQYDFIHLEYLNLENNNLTSEAIKNLGNESLKNLQHLNLSNNPITDYGLEYLNFLHNLKELILLDMPNLSNNYFSVLQSNSFIDKIDILKCDKPKLVLKHVHSNYNKFSFSNLNFLKFMPSSNLDIRKSLKLLFTLDNICSKIINLDLSNLGITDVELSLLTENILIFKKIKQIIISNKNLSNESEKYFTKLEQKEIKVILKFNKKRYNILLGGSTHAGKTTFIESYITKEFREQIISTKGIDLCLINDFKQADCIIYDSCRWGKRFYYFISRYIKLVDGIILFFDISNKNDFDNLPGFIEMIKEFHDLKDFPVLLIGNKSDLGIRVNEEEIKKFVNKAKILQFFEMSCKNHKNVEEPINFMLNYFLDKEKKSKKSNK